MDRIRVALALLLCVLATIGMPTVARADVDQSGWTSLKREIRLPNGRRMTYVEAGNPSGEPLLLLHGYTDSSRSWSLLVPALTRYRLLMPDLRGHGGTDAPACCYGPTQVADDARLFLDSLGIQRAAVVGHSFGSMVAISLAADHPERVSRFVLIGATALAPVKRGDWLYENAMALKEPLDSESQSMRDWHPANQPTSVDPAFAEAVRQEFMTIPLHVWRGVMRELASVPVARHSADVKASVLILSGGKDSLFPSEHHEALLAAFPQATGHVFPDLGHNPNWERPDQVAGMLVEFLDSTR